MTDKLKKQIMAETKQKLEIAVSQAASVAQTYNCLLTRLDFQQEDGLMSSLPLGLNRIKIERSLTTSALAVFVPFVTQELFMGGDAMYYGLNALSNNMILLDRKQSRSPNGLVFGTPGSGKSMSCKREITFIMLMTQDNVIICDPEDEYSPLVKRLGGQVIRLSPSSTDYVNPLDINLNYSEEENPLALKSDFVLSFCELIMGSKTGLEAIEKTVIDRAVQMIYQPYFADPRPENMPILGDLMEALLAQGIPEADRVAQALDLYVNGSLNFFNHRTTVDIRNRLVCFDIKGLGKNLKKPGMLIVQDAVWNTVTINRAIGRSTWYFVDEFHLLLKEEQTAAYSAEIWKRFRKWGGVPTGATQNPKRNRDGTIWSLSLSAAVFYLTPAASEGYRSTLKPTAFRGKSPSSNLSAQVIHQEQPLSEKAALNPDWVEWLMGFPKGWTAVSSGPASRRASPA